MHVSGRTFLQFELLNLEKEAHGEEKKKKKD